MGASDTGRVIDFDQTGTFEVVPRPNNRKVIDTRWIFKTKLKESGDISRRKARFVARGFTQEKGIDYSDTYSPVAITDFERVIFALAAALNLELKQADIEVAFQHQELQEEIYVELPYGWKFQQFQDRHSHVGRLRRALYGLKQSALELYRNLRRHFLLAGSIVSTADRCVFIKHGDGNKCVVASVHVNDILVAANDVSDDLKLLRILRKTFPVKVLGDVKHIFGCHIRRDRLKHILQVSQAAYVEKRW